MNQWITLFRKEILEMWRNFKWIWIPLVFIVLGMTDPLTTYYMPIILDTVGGLPEGAVIEMPVPSPNEVLLMSMNQLNMLGVLVIVLAFMGIIASERKSGLAAMILVKPVSFFNYVTAKWVSLLLIGGLSLFLGYLSGWYYTSILFGTVPFETIIKSNLILLLWYVFILTLTIFFSSIFKIGGITGFITLVSVIVLSIMTNILGDWMVWSPAQLTDSIGSLVMLGEIAEGFVFSLVSTLVIICVMVYAAIKILKNKELA